MTFTNASAVTPKMLLIRFATAMAVSNLLFGFMLPLVFGVGWQYAVVCIVVSVTMYVLVASLSSRIAKAYRFELLRAVVGTIGAVQFLGWGGILVAQFFQEYRWVIIVGTAAVFLLVAIWQYQDARRRLKLTRAHNESIGCFSRANRMWYPTKALLSREPDSQARTDWTSLARWGVALTPVLGQLLAKSGQQTTMVTAAMSVFGLLLLLGTMYWYAVASEVAALEKENGLTFTVDVG